MDESSKAVVRSLREDELDEAHYIVGFAFSSFMGIKDWRDFQKDGSYPHCRFPYNKNFAAEYEGKLVGVIFAFDRGNLGIFGPLAVLPEYQGKGIAQLLVAAVVDYLEATLPRPRRLGLCTFAQSTKHIHLYGKFGYYPGQLICVMHGQTSSTPNTEVQFASYAKLFEGKNEEESAAVEKAFLDANRDLLNETVAKGLDGATEILAIRKYNYGDTIYLPAKEGEDGRMRIDGYASCQFGARTEADSVCAKVTFAAARDAESFDRLLKAVLEWARSRGAKKVEAGTNMGRRQAFRMMRSSGWMPQFNLVAMEKVVDEPEDSPGYDRPNVFAIDDWR